MLYIELIDLKHGKLVLKRLTPAGHHLDNKKANETRYVVLNTFFKLHHAVPRAYSYLDRKQIFSVLVA
jgi:hypothetical protein